MSKSRFLRQSLILRIASMLGMSALLLFGATAQTKEKLTIECYWQNFAERVLAHLPNYRASTGCEKYEDPTHCQRTAAEMFADSKRDWERVASNGRIYTISCKRNCKSIPAPGQSYEAETDGKLMWITFERRTSETWLGHLTLSTLVL